ncbi:DUF948 domain-containing protein [Paucilactobacillus kaifaensis]|uniref:DUF948 domain-containing protein n=1 Tax=Paucilactobacillus kaifaensis TaxID=2559921 RepID=UPI0010F8894D|nr:DUF948 domain-containing protein [Paucilactobacillus kaifaensis]
MTLGQVAGLIAAIAFLILVLFIGYFLVRLSTTLKETNRSINVLTNDADALSKEVEVILSNANELLEDVNQKSAIVDPAFQAVADLGTSVSDLNSATRRITDRFSGNAKKTVGAGIVASFGRSAVSGFWQRHKNRKLNK